MILRRTIPLFLFIVGIMWLMPTRSAGQGVFRLYAPSVYSGIAFPEEPILLYKMRPLYGFYPYLKLTNPDMQQHWILHNEPVGNYPTLAPNGQTVLFANAGVLPSMGYAMRTNGTYLRPAYIVEGWSPDSTKAATIRRSSGYLYYAPIGELPRVIATDITDKGWFAWGADSQGLVYPALREGVSSVYYYDLEHGRERLLYDQGHDPYVIAAIPDGRFLVGTTQGTNTHVVRVEADGSNAVILLNFPTNPHVNVIQASVDPTGRFFVLNGTGLPTRLYTIEGAVVWEVPEYCDGSPCSISTPSWRGDGNELAFVVQNQVGGERDWYRIFLIKTDGSETEPRPIADLASWPLFSPDGRYLAYKGGLADQWASTTLHIRDLVTGSEVVLREPDGGLSPIGWFYFYP